MNTLYLLMAQYDGKAQVPLDVIASDYLNMGEAKAKRLAAVQGLPFPVMRGGDSQKARWVVDLRDLSAYLDKQREEAIATHQRMAG